jgi:hypothetical protein
MSSRAIALFGLLALVVSLAAGQPATRRSAAAQAGADTPVTLPSSALRVVARGEGVVPGAASGFVWLVRTSTAYGLQRTVAAPTPLGFALPQIGSLAVFDRQGTALARLEPGEALFLPSGTMRSFGSSDGEPMRYLQIALVATDAVPQPLPPGGRASEPFTLLAGDIVLDLAAGDLTGSDPVDLPASAYPAMLLVTGGIITAREADGGTRVLGTGESALLDGAAQVWNAGRQPSTFVLARLSPVAVAAEGDRATRTEHGMGARRLDPALDVVWERNGCPLNPANPPCLVIAQAAACAIDPAGAQCTADSDGDGCVDIAEVRLGLDAFDALDCLPDASGRPAVNCLFPIADRTCGRRRRQDGKTARDES